MEIPKKKIQVFDPPLCCSTGICGTDVDQALIDISADLDWLKSKGGNVERFNLAQQPLAFVQTPAVKSALETQGNEVLPVTLLDDIVVLTGRYPNRSELADWLEIPLTESPQATSHCCCGKKLL
jgi:hypothetical protein